MRGPEQITVTMSAEAMDAAVTALRSRRAEIESVAPVSTLAAHALGVEMGKVREALAVMEPALAPFLSTDGQ